MRLIGALDQGTTSTRFMLFTREGKLASCSQKEHRQICPKPGWVEHDPVEILTNVKLLMEDAVSKAGASWSDVAAIGIANQRETVVAWNPRTGKVWHNAIVWQDLRGEALVKRLACEKDASWLREKTGLVFSPYFSASKIAWMLDNVDGLREACESGDAVFGTMDTWLVWNLSGGKAFVTDATNASRTMLMDIRTLQWDSEMLDLFGIPLKALPEIVPSMGRTYGSIENGTPLCAILGDQQAALFGQACFDAGSAKCTYGTGCFMLQNTGDRLCFSANGLLSTVAYQREGEKPCYAIEGSIAVAGSLVNWLRDNLRLFADNAEMERLADEAGDNGGVHIVPAFAGLLAPYWRSDARGVFTGLTSYTDRRHICRAATESVAFQVFDVVKAFEADSGMQLPALKVDGGLSNNALLMRFQADILGIPVVRPQNCETTALGAAFAAGLSSGLYKSLDELATLWHEGIEWNSSMDCESRELRVSEWHEAVFKSFGHCGQGGEQ